MISWLRDNFQLKVVSLLLAAVVWYFVHGITSERQTIRGVPLEVRVRPGVTIVEQSVAAVDVVMRGTRDDVRRLSRNEISAVLDLTGATPLGEKAYRLGAGTIRHPRWVQPSEVVPAEVRLTLDETGERSVEVEARIVGEQELPAGYIIERVVIKPSNVVLRGPKSRLQQLGRIPTLPIDVAGRSTSFRERVELMPLELGTRLAERHWVEVDVRLGRAPAADVAPAR